MVLGTSKERNDFLLLEVFGNEAVAGRAILEREGGGECNAQFIYRQESQAPDGSGIEGTLQV